MAKDLLFDRGIHCCTSFTDSTRSLHNRCYLCVPIRISQLFAGEKIYLSRVEKTQYGKTIEKSFSETKKILLLEN